MTELQTIDAWSISRLFDFETCPHRSYLAIIAKAPRPEYPDNHPMIRGRRIHTEIESYISGAEEELTVKKLRDEIDFCREQYSQGKATVEQKWGYDPEWSPVDWMSENVWCRMATDAFISLDEAEAVIYDWKTGKSFGNEVKYMQQMQLYAIGAFMRFPDLEAVDVKLGFVDEGKLRNKEFERGDKLNRLVARFTERGTRMTSSVDFRPKPNVYSCKWCPFGPSGTKACIYGVEAI